MTDAPHLSNETPQEDWADRTELAVLDAAIGLAPRLGWNSRLVRAACAAEGLSLGDEELLLPTAPETSPPCCLAATTTAPWPSSAISIPPR